MQIAAVIVEDEDLGEDPQQSPPRGARRDDHERGLR